MNKQLHRIVFNAARGLRMVVQETAKSVGKATGSFKPKRAAAPVLRAPPAIKVIASLLALLQLTPSLAQIRADLSAPGTLRPQVLVAPNGVPLVNITTPSAAGVSHNVYSQFDVNGNGAILNNSRTNAQTQLGGWVQGNPWLAGGPARIILNEVHSANPSQLRGYVEVAGQRAEVVIANPAGIQVDGGGFMNASRVTLSTGAPQLNALGGLDSFLVRGGTISIDGAGLDLSRTDYAAILARAVSVNAGIWASELKVVTGANQVAADQGAITPTAASGAAPAFALDVSQLGGMYAGKITLIGTEAGLGVRNAGTLIAANGTAATALAGVGQLVVSAAGRLENIGTIQASADAKLGATALSNSGTIASGASLKLATQGDLVNSGGTLEAQSVQLASAAGDIDNRGGTIRQTSLVGLTLAAPTLSNSSGGVLGAEPLPAPSTGSGAGGGGTGGTADPATGGSAGTSGSTAPTPVFVPLAPGSITAAGAIRNDGGRIYAGGPITLQTPQLNNAGGSLNVATLSVAGPSFSNAGGTLNVSNGFQANVGQFDNTGGALHAGALAIAASGDLLNQNGTLASDSDASLAVGGSLTNTHGTISAAGALSASVAGAADNSAGSLIANQGVAIATHSLNNSQGAIQSAQAGVGLTVGQQLRNTEGSIAAAIDLVLRAGSLSSSGTLRGTNDVTVAVGSALSNDGSITAGRHASITADSLQSGSASTLGAGIQNDGKMGTDGNLSVTVTQGLAAHGSNLAAGSATLQGASVDLSGSQTSAANITITATQGNVTTSQASVVTPGTLVVAANAKASQTLVNAAGLIGAGQLDLNASNIVNAHGGEIVQTGTGATRIATTGRIDNSSGLIASNGQDLGLQAAALTNAGGRIQHAGSGKLGITATSYSGAKGEITGNGALVVNVAGNFNQDGGSSYARQITIDAGALSNQRGKIVQGESGAARITVVGALNNNAGTLASNGSTNIAAGSLSNQGGSIRAAEASNLDITVTALLDNSGKGEIGAGANATVRAGSLANDSGRITAVDDLGATIAGAATNRGGTLAANGNATVQATSLNNNGGTAVAVHGDLRVATAGATTNVQGTLQAGGNTVLANGGFDNTLGKTFGNAVSLDTRGRQFVNTQGTLAATTTVDLQTGALNNAAGLIQSGGAMTIDTHGQQLSNSNAAGYDNKQGGITSGNTLTLAAGAVDNTGGFIGSRNALNAGTQSFSNTGGAIVLSQAALAIDTNGASYDNRGGQTQVVGDLRVDAGAVQNSGGLIRSMATTTLNAASVDNSATLGTDQGIEGLNVAIASGSLNNRTGAIRADQNATITSGGSVDNTGGLMSAADTLRIADPHAANAGAKTLAITNTNGTLVADKSLQLDAATFSGDGKAVSGKSLAIALTQDIVNNGEVSANGNLSYTTTGNLSNNGKLLAGGTLTVGGNSVVNAANAEMSGGTTVVNAGTLTNRGLIDGADTRINAGTVNNLGTGRIYGDLVSIGAGSLNNDAEAVNGVISAGTIAARDALDIGAGTINNREHALIFSGASMAIGGGLDTNRQAIGQASVVNNTSATIESLGDMSLSAAAINNTDAHMQMVRDDYPTVALPVTIIPTGLGVELPWDPAVIVTDDQRNWATIYDGQLRTGKGWIVMARTDTLRRDEAVNAPDPGRIVSGGNMSIDGMLHNRDSHVLAGGSLTIAPGNVDNSPTQGQEVIDHGGVSVFVPGTTGNNLVTLPIPVQQEVHTITIGASRIQQFTNGTTGSAPGAAQNVAVGAQAGATGAVNGSTRAGTIFEVPSAVGGFTKTAGSTAETSNAANGESGAGRAGTISLVVRTRVPDLSVPNASLFRTLPGSNSQYLIETDPRFANYHSWLSSDYMLSALGLNPNNILKRLGDGFYEQKLIREQVAQLTGYRYLDGFSNDQDEYTALMNAGVTFAKQYVLTPGIALTATQMAQLTSDIVWLVEQTVTLPDGSTQRVLVPQVYVRVQPGDIDGGGSLLSADAMIVKGKGDLMNRGTIAGRVLVSINADNVNNLGGRITGGDIGINASADLNNIAGSITAHNSAVLTAGRDINIKSTTQSASSMGASITNVDRVAGVYVTDPGGVLIASTGRDVNLIGAAMASAGSAAVGAGRDINLGTVTESSNRAMLFAGGRHNAALVESQSRDIGSAIVGNGNVRLAAGNDLNIKAGSVASAEGALVATAANDINITAGQAAQSLATGATSRNKTIFSRSSAANFDADTTTDVVSSTLSGNTVALVAGNDITTRAAVLQSNKAMSLTAGRDITLGTADRSTSAGHIAESKTSATSLGMATGIAFEPSTPVGSRLVKGRSSTDIGVGTSTQAIGTTVSAGSLQTVSGRDTTVQGATVVADNDIAMLTGRNLTIESAQNTTTDASFNSNSRSGMIGSWYNPSLGNVKSAEATTGSRTTQSASQVASLQGNVTLAAGDTYRQTASSILAVGQAGALAGGDVNILANNILVNEALNAEQSLTIGRNSSTVLGGSVSVGGLSTDSLKSAANTIKAIGNTSDSRMQALGAANLAMTGKQAYDTVSAVAGGEGLGFKVSVNVSRNSAQSASIKSASEAVGSSIVGANNVNIIATGGAQDSNIQAVGSTIAAGNTVNLSADNNILLEASKNSFNQVGNSSGSGASVGVGFALGSQNGFTIELGVSQGRGKDNVNDVSYNNTHVSGANGVSITSGGNLTLRGAVVDGITVNAEVGGNLAIESLQDTSLQTSRQSSSGLNVSLCIPPICYGVSTAGGNASGAKANGAYASVKEQSGIKAGDDGFNVSVAGNTDLKGGVIESTQVAIDNNKNTFKTAGTLNTSDIQNFSTSSGSSYAVSGSVGFAVGNQAGATSAADKRAAANASINARPGGSAGVGSLTGNSQTSTTKAGISGIAGDQTVRTGDQASTGALVKDWNTQTIIKDVQAQAQIMAEFGTNASAAVGTYANGKLEEAKALYQQAAGETDPDKKAALYAQAAEIENNWKEGGAYRIAAHAGVGALTGGASGAAGALASSIAIPAIGERIAELDMPVPVKQALVMATGAAIGVAVGGAAGSASAYNETANNYLTASDLRSREQKIKRCQAMGDTACEVNVLREYEIKSARNTGELKRESIIEKIGLERTRADLEELLLDPSVGEQTKRQARISIKEINTAINVIDKRPVIREAFELGLIATDVITLGGFAAAKLLTTSVVKEVVLNRTGKELSDDAAARIANNFYRDGAPVEYGTSRLITNPNEAIFWSGRTDGIGGVDVAAAAAERYRGMTLEHVMERRLIDMPLYDPTNPSSVEPWTEISEQMAKNASGEVRAVIGTQTRPNSIWEEIELPALKANPSVTRVIRVDPKTMAETVLYERGR